MKSIGELSKVIAPPVDPRVTVTDAEWLEVFSHIGTRLPEDFIQFHKTYGEGYFYSQSHPSSSNISIYAGKYAASSAHSSSFRQAVPKRLSELRLIKERRPKCIPFPLYWEAGGLLPWGRASNNTDLCWLVRGNLVDDWKVVVLRVAQAEHEVYDLCMAEFLALVISSANTCKLLPEGFPGEKGVGFAVWKFS